MSQSIQSHLYETERIAALNEYNILDTLPEKEYDEITLIASQICDTPISLITLIDPERQWFKSTKGLDVTETPRELAFCSHAINDPNEVMVINDSRHDARFKDNPLVTGDPYVIFYAGAPLNTPEGHSLGTLCVVDHKPNNLTDVQKEALKSLAKHVVTLFELRKKNRELTKLNTEIQKANEELDKFSFQLSHDLCTPTRAILMVNEWIKDDYEDKLDDSLKEKLGIIYSKTKYMHSLIQEMLSYAKATRSDITYESFNLEEIIMKIVYDYNQVKIEDIHLVNMKENIYQSRIALSVCFQNLLSNSIKYNDKEKCKIKISLQCKDEEYVIRYEDNGPGIDKKYHDRVFEIYETLGPKSDTSTGIGLATVKGTLEKLGGKISFTENTELSGISYIIKVPKVLNDGSS